jgi:flagellar basal-body rod protein FlgF
MGNALLVGLSRQVALQRELDVVANNIANINTNGFKADGAVFEEFIGKVARSDDMSMRGRQVSFVRDRATWIDMSQGATERTGNPLDVAIVGKGFLAVQTPAGERYTRNGGLQVNNIGQLVTSEGYQVLGESGPIVLQPKDRDVSISQDGTISVREGENTVTESERGKLRLVNFAQAGQLQKDGTGTFKAPNGIAPAPELNSHFSQGSIEKSNVHSVLEMTRMIEVTRSYTQVATMLAQQSDLQKSAIEKLADVPN